MIPESVKTASMLSGGKKVRVIAEGKTYEFDGDVDQQHSKDNTLAYLLLVLVKADERRTEEIRRLEEEINQLRDAVDKNSSATESVVDTNKAVLQSIAKLDATMRLPVVGVREGGKLIARRSEK
jgi:hypothetical protein